MARMSCLLLLCMFSRCVSASDTTRVQQWIEHELRRADAPIVLDDYSITFEYVDPPTMTPQQLRTLKARIATTPDHPDHARVTTEERRHQGDGDITLISIVAPSPDTFRISKTFLWNDDYTDIGRDERAAWSLTANQLNIVQPGNSPITKNFATARSDIDFYLGLLFSGGMRFTPSSEIQIVSVSELDPGGFLVELVNTERGWSAQAQIRWSTEHDRGFVQRLRYTSSTDNPDLVGSGFEVDSWKHDPLANRWLAQNASMSFYGTTITLQNARTNPITSAEQSVLVRTPDPIGEDPLRGLVTATSVYDHRPREEQITYYDRDRASIGKAPLGRSGGRSIVWIGRAVLLGCLFIAVGTYMHQRRNA